MYIKLEDRKDGGEKEKELVNKIIRRWRLFRLLKQMPVDVVNDPGNGLQRVILSEPGGSSLEVLMRGGRIVSWKNDRGEELLFSGGKTTGRSPAAVSEGISVCFPQVNNLGKFEQHEYARNRLWSLDKNNRLDQASNGSHSSINLVLKPSEKDLKTWPCRFELRIHISLSQGKLTLTPSVKNTGDKSLSFRISICNYLSVSDINEVRIEGLETLEYLDNSSYQKRFTEQADALTFDCEVNRTYLSTPPKIAIIDHEKRRTFELHKQGLPDAVVWNPWNKPSKSFPYLGEDYKTMLSVDSAVVEKPIILKPFQVWRGFQEIATVSSSYCSGQLDPRKVLQNIS